MTPCIFLYSSIELKVFPKKPPYKEIPFYLFQSETSLKSLEEGSFLNTCSVMLNHKNRSFKENLTLIKPPKCKTILWIGSRKKQCALLKTLLEAGNFAKTLFSIKKELIETTYIETKPDIIIAPIHIQKKLHKLILKHLSEQKPLLMLYPSANPKRNFIVTLSKKTSKASSATEAFLLKKLILTKEGKVTLKKEKQSIFNGKLSSPFKGFHPISFSIQDKVIGIGESQEDLRLGLGGFFYELEKRQIPTAMYTPSVDIDSALSCCEGSLYLFTAEKAKFNPSLLKKLKQHLKNHPDQSVFIGYYATPWRDTWNLYHYDPLHGDPEIAKIGLTKLCKNQPLSLKDLGGSFGECYLLKNYF